ncbi:MAG: hypothetical protein R2822_29575 [Spirosomataceae bacterium]
MMKIFQLFALTIKKLLPESNRKKPEVKRVLSDRSMHVNRQLDAAVDTIAAKTVLLDLRQVIACKSM